MADRSTDWLRQAERNQDQAKDCATAGRHEWACFAAQQSAEAAVKALRLRLGQDAWRYVIRRMLEEVALLVTVPANLIDAARVLDAHYIPTRHANGHSEGAPGEHYGALQSGEAIGYAGQIIGSCRSQMAGA